jgi:hypothetical protein
MNILKSLSIDVDQYKAQKTLKLYIEIKNTMDKLQNRNNIPNSQNELLWFDYYLSIKKDMDEFTNIKKAFIYGFGLNQTIIFDPSTKSYLNINNLSTQYTTSTNTLSAINDMGVYLYNNSIKNELSIIINSNLDTLVECNLYNYNPLFLETVNISSNMNTNIFQKLFNKLINIYKNKHKYINYLNTTNYNDDNLQKLHSYPNNYTEYIIKLWTTDIDLNKKYHQFGGVNNKYIKIKLDKIPSLLQKLNINKYQFKKLIKKYNYTIINDYLYFNSI